MVLNLESLFLWRRESGIRTHGQFNPSHDFQSYASFIILDYLAITFIIQNPLFKPRMGLLFMYLFINTYIIMVKKF